MLIDIPAADFGAINHLHAAVDEAPTCARVAKTVHCCVATEYCESCCLPVRQTSHQLSPLSHLPKQAVGTLSVVAVVVLLVETTKHPTDIVRLFLWCQLHGVAGSWWFPQMARPIPLRYQVAPRRSAASWWLVAALAMLLQLPGWQRIHAAPPIVGPLGQHVYDPDWPEVQQIITNKCLSCHRPNAKQADLSTHDALFATRDDEDHPMVKPGDPEGSLLWNYVRWNADEEPDSLLPDRPEMPAKKSEWLSAGQLEAMYRWIERGARVYVCDPPCGKRPLTELAYPSARVCAGCHPKQYTEWSRSMHAYAQRSPVFEAFNLTLVERTSGTIGTFCSRCHTPIGTALGENESQRNVDRTRISLEGVSCIVCHPVRSESPCPPDTVGGCC